MPTFAELQTQFHEAQARLRVIEHLIEYIDENFRPVAGAEPKNKLLDENHIPVAPAMFEAVVTDVLLKAADEHKAQLTKIATANIADAKAETAPAQESKKAKGKKGKNAEQPAAGQQGESK